MQIPIGFGECERHVGGPADMEHGDQNILKKSHENRIKFQDKKNEVLVTYIGNTYKTRIGLIDKLRKKKFIHISDKLRFEDYMIKINEYKFVLCPRGCGTDTHRFWETILMGSVPIIESCGLDDLYNKFPCIILDNFDNLNIKCLENFEFDNKKSLNTEKYLVLENLKKEIFSFFEKGV